MDAFVRWFVDSNRAGHIDRHVPHPYWVFAAFVVIVVLQAVYRSWRARQPAAKDLRGDRVPPPDQDD